MSQIGRCSCGEILAKKSFSTANSSEEMTVEVCPKCDEKKFFSLFGKSIVTGKQIGRAHV